MLLAEHDGERLNFNDILAAPRGRLYAGTWYWGAERYDKPGKLYLIEPGGAVSVLDEGIEMSNGLGLSPDGEILYYADSSARRIYAYEVYSPQSSASLTTPGRTPHSPSTSPELCHHFWVAFGIIAARPWRTNL